MTDAVQRAYALAQAGDNAAAADLLGAAGEQGDATALAALGAWYLMGDRVGRNLGQGRALLGRAAQLGNDDAALLETALLANGTGGPRNWPAAVNRLRNLAGRLSVASHLLALLDAQLLDADGMPLSLPAAEPLDAARGVICWRAFLSPAECALIARTAQDLLQPSTVADPATGQLIRHPVRTSLAAPLGPTRESLPLQAILRRIGAATGTVWHQAESLTVLHYGPGQEYREHLDTLPGEVNQRIGTMILYLNDDYLGGETVFPLLDIRFKARAGDALFFPTVTPDGRPDPLMRHAGRPVTSGAKWVATRWIRAAPFDPWTAAAG